MTDETPIHDQLRATFKPRRVRIRQQRKAIRRQRAHGHELRGWLSERAQAAEKRLKKRRKKEAKAARGTRGVDRVPERFRDQPRETEYLVRHEPAPNVFGRWTNGTPYVNPGRDERSRRSGRLRKELR